MTPATSHRSTLADLGSLVKPRIVGLLCLTGLSAAVAAGVTDPIVLGAFALAGACMSGGAAALNCYHDRDIDARMARTADRPLPAGRLCPRVALWFAVALLLLGSAVGLGVLPFGTVAYMWGGVASYVGLYTVALKRRHPIGVVLGGSAGSFPVLAGWRMGGPVAPEALAMALLVFLWTPAHAWALAHVYREEFAAVGVPTLPVAAGVERTRRAVWVAAVCTAALALALAPLIGAGFAVVALVAGVPFLAAFRAYRRRGTDPRAVWAFFASNTYLAVLFVAWAVAGVVPDRAPALPLAGAVGVPLLFRWLGRRRPSLGGVRAAAGPDASAVARRVAGSLGAWLGVVRE